MTSVAVVGTGSAGRRHIANLRRVGCEEVVAVSEHNRLPHLEIDGASVDVLHDYHEALKSVDAVVIANPTSQHLDYSLAAVEAGCHILCEKPIATSAAGVRGLAEQAALAGVVVAVGCQFRFNELLVDLRERVGAGDLGTIIDVDANQGENLADYHPDEDYRISYAARSELGGGVLLTQIHQLDFLHWIFGPFERVFAVGGHRTGLELDVEDTVTYLLETEDGAAVRGHLDFTQRPKRMDLTVTGTGARLRWDYYGNELELTDSAPDGDSTVRRAPFDRNTMFVALVGDFLEAIERGRPPRTTVSSAAAVMELVDAIRQSLEERRSVEITSKDRHR